MQKYSLNIDEDKIKGIMEAANIPSVAIAFIEPDGNITTQGISQSSNELENNVVRDAVFGAASLSKPVFAYLVLKLVEIGKLNLTDSLNTILPFKKFCDNHHFKWNVIGLDWIENVTVQMALSHTTGLNLSGDKINFLFKPGKEYAYSNLGLFYLQKVIEEITHQSLEQLAQEHVFGDNALKMKNSTFYRNYDLKEIPKNNHDYLSDTIYINPADEGLHYKVIGLDGKLKSNIIPWDKLPNDFPRSTSDIIQNKEKYLNSLLNYTAHAGHTTLSSAVAVYSLFTTAHDYAIFIKAWMKLKKEHNELMQSAFEPHQFMMTDTWAKDFKIPENDLERLASGFTWELELNEQKTTVLKGYKTGDMVPWTASAALDFEKESAIIYFANSKKGHLLAEEIVFKNVELEHAPNFFFQKWGFARKLEVDWEKKEQERMDEISAYEHGYNLVLITGDPTRKHGTIYIRSSTAGLYYEVFSPEGELRKNTIPWDKLSGVQESSAVIIKNKEHYLPFIVTQLLKEGHIRPSRCDMNTQQTLNYSKIEMSAINSQSFFQPLKKQPNSSENEEDKILTFRLRGG